MKTLLAALACLLVLLSLAACGDDDEEAATSTPVGSATPANVCTANPDPATKDTNAVTAPRSGDRITSPVEVTGEISAFEATFQITIFDARQNEIADQVAMSNEGQTLAPFSASVPFEVTEETEACLWVYELSPADGRPINVAQIPVTLLP